MTTDKLADQPTLFDAPERVEATRIVLYALGDFQSRGKVLADRPLALDRLRGAFKRAAEKFQIAELADDVLAAALESLGARVVRRPSFVAKHPFHVTVGRELAQAAVEVYREAAPQKADPGREN